jgi:hypothetical protein
MLYHCAGANEEELIVLQRCIFIALMVSGVACTEPNANYNGQIQGQSFSIADAAYMSKFYSGTTLGTGTSVTASVVVLSTSYTMCDDIQTQRVYPNEQFLALVFAEQGTTGLTPLQGNYDIGSGQYGQDSAECQPGAPLFTSGGSLTFTKGDYASGGNAEATFTVDFTSGDTGTGSFQATPCSYMETFLDAIVDEVFGSQQQTGTIYLINGTCA